MRLSNIWSGLRGSNSLPPPWQGGALPNELNPHILKIGASGRNRTIDTRIFSPLLYRLSYRGKVLHCVQSIKNKMPTALLFLFGTFRVKPKRVWRSEWDSNPRPPPWQGGVLTNWTTRPKCGGNNRARTYDPLLVRQMLSQLSYAPTFVTFFKRRNLLYII